MELPVDGQPDDQAVPLLPPPTVDEQLVQLHERLQRVEAHIGLVNGPPQLNFGPEQIAKVVGLVGLNLNEESVEIVRRVLSAGNLVSARIV